MMSSRGGVNAKRGVVGRSSVAKKPVRLSTTTNTTTTTVSTRGRSTSNEDWDRGWDDTVSQLSEASSGEEEDGHHHHGGGHSHSQQSREYSLQGQSTINNSTAASSAAAVLLGRPGYGRQTSSQQAVRLLQEKQKERLLLEQQAADAERKLMERKRRRRSPSRSRREKNGSSVADFAEGDRGGSSSPDPNSNGDEISTPKPVGTAALELIYFHYFNQRITREDLPEVLRYLQTEETVIQSEDFLDDVWAGMVENVPSPYVDYARFATVLQSYGLGGDSLEKEKEGTNDDDAVVVNDEGDQRGRGGRAAEKEGSDGAADLSCAALVAPERGTRREKEAPNSQLSSRMVRKELPTTGSVAPEPRMSKESLSRLLKPTLSSSRKTRDQSPVGPARKPDGRGVGSRGSGEGGLYHQTSEDSQSRPKSTAKKVTDAGEKQIVERLYASKLKQGVAAVEQQMKVKRLAECNFAPETRPLPKKHTYSDAYCTGESINHPNYSKQRFMRCTDTWSRKVDDSVLDVSGGPALPQEVVTEEDMEECTFAPVVNDSYHEDRHPAPAVGYLEAVTALRKSATYHRDGNRSFQDKLRDHGRSITPTLKQQQQQQQQQLGCMRHHDRVGAPPPLSANGRTGKVDLMTKPITRIPVYIQSSPNNNNNDVQEGRNSPRGLETASGEIFEEIPISPSRPDPTNIAKAFCDTKGYALNDPNRIEIERTLRYVIEQSLIPRYNTKPSQRLYSHADKEHYKNKASAIQQHQHHQHATQHQRISSSLSRTGSVPRARSSSATRSGDVGGRHTALRAPSPVMKTTPVNTRTNDLHSQGVIKNVTFRR